MRARRPIDLAAFAPAPLLDTHAATRVLGTLAAALLLVSLAPAPVGAAQPAQVRTYADVDWRVLHARSGPPDRGLSPFLREELRFDAGGLAYRKWAAGARVKLLPWLSLAVHYAHATATPPGAAASSADLAVGDVVLAWRFGRILLKNRQRNEWHFTQGFYRYRNLVEGVVESPLPWLSLFVHEEIRVDADQGRVNVNNAGAGLQLTPWKPLVIRVFVEAESSRRTKPAWQTTPYLGLMASVHL